MTTRKRVVVFGASGFIGRAVVEGLRSRGALVVPLTTPRLWRNSAADNPPSPFSDEINSLAPQLKAADSVVNASGVADASSGNEELLVAANSLVPGYLASAASLAMVPRFVQISSAAVQGRARVLDSSTAVNPFSPYSRSKAEGEVLVRKAHSGAVCYRPPGVHGPDRQVSRMAARIARSRVSSVARPGSSPSPQALLKNVADAVAFLATTELQPPTIVHHPSEGLTTSSLLSLLGDRPPFEIPRPLARSIVWMLKNGGSAIPQLGANARRLEVLWFGQSQAPSWLTEAGWDPPAGPDAWRELGALLAHRPQYPDERLR
jgi:nucleoside-diphosphate-sugar epimerase